MSGTHRIRTVALAVAFALSMMTASALAQDTACDDLCTDGDACRELAASSEPELAQCLYQVACNLGDAQGCTEVAHGWMRGEDADVEVARVYYEEACNLGDVVGCGGLGVLYAEGLGGPAFPSEAVELLRPACEAQWAPACHTLGDLYATGRGIAADPWAAESLYATACDLGHQPACDVVSPQRSEPVRVASAPTLSPDALAAIEAAAAHAIDDASFVVLESGPRGEHLAGTQHLVTRPLQVLAAEVTLAQWYALFGVVPALADECVAPDCPVTRISFWDAIALANAWSDRSGLNRCYVPIDCVGRPGVDLACAEVVSVGPGCDGMRLPSAAEYLVLSQGGIGESLTCGTDDGCLDRSEWHAVNSGSNVQAVRSLEPSSLGLYDVYGNVREWLWHDHETVLRGIDPAPNRVGLGWTWGNSVGDGRDRFYETLYPVGPLDPSLRRADTGVRLVRTDTTQACAAGTTTAAGAGVCCYEGQTVRDGRCEGEPTCPNGTLAAGGWCSAEAWQDQVAADEAERRDRRSFGFFVRETRLGLHAGVTPVAASPDPITSDPLPWDPDAELPSYGYTAHRRAAFEMIVLTRHVEVGLGTRMWFGSGFEPAPTEPDGERNFSEVSGVALLTSRFGFRGITWPRVGARSWTLIDLSTGLLHDWTYMSRPEPGMRVHQLSYYISNRISQRRGYLGLQVDVPVAAWGRQFAPAMFEVSLGAWLSRRSGPASDLEAQ